MSISGISVVHKTSKTKFRKILSVLVIYSDVYLFWMYNSNLCTIFEIVKLLSRTMFEPAFPPFLN